MQLIENGLRWYVAKLQYVAVSRCDLSSVVQPFLKY